MAPSFDNLPDEENYEDEEEDIDFSGMKLCSGGKVLG